MTGVQTCALPISATTLVLKAGDVFSIAGVESVNPLNFQASGNDMQFVVTADVTSDGAGAATVPINPTIISDTSNPRRNVSVPVPNAEIGRASCRERV